MRKAAPDRGHKTEGLGAARDEDGHAADTDTGCKVHEAVLKALKCE